eukprot:tig00021275_g19887.t1
MSWDVAGLAGSFRQQLSGAPGFVPSAEDLMEEAAGELRALREHLAGVARYLGEDDRAPISDTTTPGRPRPDQRHDGGIANECIQDLDSGSAAAPDTEVLPPCCLTPATAREVLTFKSFRGRQVASNAKGREFIPAKSQAPASRLPVASSRSRSPDKTIVAMARSGSLLAAVIFFTAAAACFGGSLTYKPVNGPNPLKGWASFYPQDNSAGTDWAVEFSYIPLSDVFVGPNSFAWGPVDEILGSIGARGHHAVIRFYMDYPGRPSAIPKFLLSSGVKATAYSDYGNGPSLSPDYDNPILGSALETFIAALGAKYDGDVRIGSIMLGLVGYWGEWHTYPSNDLAPSQAIKDRIARAFLKAFKQTKIVARNPDEVSAGLPIGFHDDSFVHETLVKSAPTYSFMTRLGKVFPDIAKSMWDSNPAADPGNGATVSECIRTTRASWMIFAKGFDAICRINAAGRAMGYELHAIFAPTATSTLRLTVHIENRGVAPFYYKWPVQARGPANVALRGADGKVASQWTTNWDIRATLPGQPFAYTTVRSTTSVPRGQYTVSMRVANPLPAGLPFRFANAEQSGAWLDLGSVTLA